MVKSKQIAEVSFRGALRGLRTAGRRAAENSYWAHLFQGRGRRPGRGGRAAAAAGAAEVPPSEGKGFLVQNRGDLDPS